MSNGILPGGLGSAVNLAGLASAQIAEKFRRNVQALGEAALGGAGDTFSNVLGEVNTLVDRTVKPPKEAVLGTNVNLVAGDAKVPVERQSDPLR